MRICNHLAHEYKPKIYNNLVLSAVCISTFNMTILNVPAMHVLSPPGNNAAVTAPAVNKITTDYQLISTSSYWQPLTFNEA